MNICLPRKVTSGLSGFGASKTQSHLAKFCDINTMIARAVAGDSSVFRRGEFADLSEVPETMQEMLNKQVEAQAAYDALPEEVRKRYSSPQLFLEAANNPESAAEFVKFGLSIKRESDKPMRVEVVNSSVNPEGVKASTPPPAL